MAGPHFFFREGVSKNCSFRCCRGSSRLRHNAPQGKEKPWPLLPGRLRQQGEMHAGARRLWQTCGAKPGLQGLPRAALQEAPLRMRKGALWHAASFNEGPATSIGRTVAADGRLVAALRGEVLRMRFEKRGAPDHKTAWLSGLFSKGKLSNTCALQHVFPVTPPEKKVGVLVICCFACRQA